MYELLTSFQTDVCPVGDYSTYMIILPSSLLRRISSIFCCCTLFSSMVVNMSCHFLLLQVRFCYLKFPTGPFKGGGGGGVIMKHNGLSRAL